MSVRFDWFGSFRRVFCVFLCVSFIFLFSGCEFLGGIASIEPREDVNQSLVENFFVKNTSLEGQNITVVNSIVVTIENLRKLQEELTSIDEQINNITLNLKNLENNSNLDPIAVENLKYLRELADQSQFFINSLQDSSNFWYNYLNNTNKNVQDLNFSYDEEEIEGIVSSIGEPLKAFEK